ncbi:MAG: hypothetical protein EHM20_00205 [Alphaproteobacteria bacterium]|nr:MAG: hypothetical protein EHM20_00205 [Alphaproteobacteria bacterium]
MKYKTYNAGEIKSRVKILDLINNYMVNTNKTRVDVGYVYEYCPFCQHKNHFQINTKLNLYMSHSRCCKGGSVIDFYMEMNHCNFNEACKYLGERFNITQSVETFACKHESQILSILEFKENQRINQEINDFLGWACKKNNEQLNLKIESLLDDENRLYSYILNLKAVGYYG